MLIKRFKLFFEATEGEGKWVKYFANSPNDVLTKTKKTDFLYSLNGEKNNQQIPINSPITVFVDQEYSTKPLIKYNDEQYRFPLASIDKPIERKVSFQLKPDKFGIPERTKLKNYYNLILEKILTKEGLTPEIKDYLNDLVGFAFNRTSPEDVKDSFIKTNPDSGFINTINNDFMEIIGPIIAANYLGLTDNCVIYFPSKGNEELLDFKIYNGNEEYVFSSKTSAKKKTNLLSPKNILAGLKDKKIDSNFLEALRIVSTSSIKSCPIKLAEYFKISSEVSSVRDLLDLEKTVIKKLNDMGVDKWTEIVRLSVGDLFVIKLHIDKSGVPVVNDNTIVEGNNINKAEWRSKNSPNHWDRIGFQL